MNIYVQKFDILMYVNCVIVTKICCNIAYNLMLLFYFPSIYSPLKIILIFNIILSNEMEK